VETRAHYALVGAVVILMSVAAAVFVIWLGQYSFDQETVEYDVVFSGPVRGLSESGEVRFNGIKVGEITRLGLDPSNPNRVIARIRVDAETPIKEDSVAQVEPQGLTGVSYIQITGGTPDAPRLRRAPGQRTPPVIFAKEGPIEGFVANAEDVMREAGQALRQVQVLLRDENIDEFSEFLANLNEISETVNENKEMFERISSAVVELEAAAANVARLAETSESVVGEDTRRAIAAIEDAAREIQSAADEIGQLADNADQNFEELTDSSSAQLNRLMADLQLLTESVDRILGQLEENPSGFLAGSPKQEVEIPR